MPTFKRSETCWWTKWDIKACAFQPDAKHSRWQYSPQSALLFWVKFCWTCIIIELLYFCFQPPLVFFMLSLINILHSKLYFSVCFQSIPLTTLWHMSLFLITKQVLKSLSCNLSFIEIFHVVPNCLRKECFLGPECDIYYDSW